MFQTSKTISREEKSCMLKDRHYLTFLNFSSESLTQSQQWNNQQWNRNHNDETTIPPKFGASRQNSWRMKEKKWFNFSCVNISCIKQYYSIECGKYSEVRAIKHWSGLNEAFQCQIFPLLLLTWVSTSLNSLRILSTLMENTGRDIQKLSSPKPHPQQGWLQSCQEVWGLCLEINK